MKNPKNNFYKFLFIIFLSVLLSGCAASLLELSLIRGAGLRAGAGAAARAAMGTAVRSSLRAGASVSSFEAGINAVRLVRTASKAELILPTSRGSVAIGEVVGKRSIRFYGGSKVALPGRIYTTRSSVNLKKGPGEHYKILGEIKEGDVLLRLEKIDNWYKVRSFENAMIGYVLASSLDPVSVKDENDKDVEMPPKDISDYLDSNKTKNNPKTISVAVIVANNQTTDTDLCEKIKKVLEANSYEVTTLLFSKDLVDEGYFKKIFDGEINDFSKQGLHKYVDFIMLIDKPASYFTNQFNMFTANCTVNFKTISASSGKQVNLRTFKMAGAGFTKEQANLVLNNHIRDKAEMVKFTF